MATPAPSTTVQLTPLPTAITTTTGIAANGDEPTPSASEAERRDSSEEERARAQQPSHEFSLPPVDGGKDAWLFLAGCFVLEGLVWGFPFSYGVFLDYYSRDPLFSPTPLSRAHPISKTGGLAVVGTLASGLMYLSAPAIFSLLHHSPSLRRTLPPLGLAILLASLIAASFATTVTHLILTQGIMYAVGGTIMYAPAIVYLDEWFVRRKGLAYGVMWAGTGVAGVVVPGVMGRGLGVWGFRVVLRGWAVVVAVLSGPLIWFVKPRLPVPARRSRSVGGRRVDYGFARMPMFWCLELANIMQGLGFFIPGLYLPSYYTSTHPTTSPTIPSLLLSLLSTSSIPGQIALGLLTDRLHITTVLAISSTGSLLSTFALWLPTSSLGPLIAFTLLYGFFAGGYTACYSGTILEVRRRQREGGEGEADAGLVVGWLGFGRGVGNVVAGPVSEAILRRAAGGVGGKGGYGGLIVFTGVMAGLGGLGILGRVLRL